MRELFINELDLISGAADNNAPGFIESGVVGAAIGGFLGVAQGGGVAVAATAGTAGAYAGGGLGLAFAGGYAIGGLINDYTPIQSWISSGIDRLTRDGNDYCRDGGNY